MEPSLFKPRAFRGLTPPAQVSLLFFFIAGCAVTPREPPRLEDYRHDITHCHVHGELLRDDIVDVDHAHCQYVAGHYRFRDAVHPYSNLSVTDAYAKAKRGRVQYCPQCRHVYQRLVSEVDEEAFMQEWHEATFAGEFDAFVRKYQDKFATDASAPRSGGGEQPITQRYRMASDN